MNVQIPITKGPDHIQVAFECLRAEFIWYKFLRDLS